MDLEIDSDSFSGLTDLLKLDYLFILSYSSTSFKSVVALFSAPLLPRLRVLFYWPKSSGAYTPPVNLAEGLTIPLNLVSLAVATYLIFFPLPTPLLSFFSPLLQIIGSPLYSPLSSPRVARLLLCVSTRSARRTVYLDSSACLKSSISCSRTAWSWSRLISWKELLPVQFA